MRLKLSEIVKATGGELLCGDEETVITSFSADSREIKGGTMFVPIKGERTDSHSFIDVVFEAGAAATFTEEKIPARQQPVVLVKNSREALQKAAAYYRSCFEIPIVGITGSAGKTTAKEMVALALSPKFNTLKTAGNQNSQIGVPLTICRLKKDHKAAVVEMGVSLPGEMARIAPVVKANYAVVTNIGVSHIEFLKSRENIMEEKLHIADFLPKDGIVFVNGDDDLLHTLNKKSKHQIRTFGTGFDCDIKASAMRHADNGTHFTYEYKGEKAQVFVPAAGLHNVRNALASIAVARALGVNMEDAVRAIAAYKPPAMRQQFFKSGNVTIIDDSYNASPDSMLGAIDILTQSSEPGRKIAVLGDMLELGHRAEQDHTAVGAYARKQGIDLLLAVGEQAKNICKGFGEENSIWFDSNEKAIAYLKATLKEGDIVLLKGSRGMQLDDIVTALKNEL